MIYFDFAKAFDSVSHDKILEKLKNQFNINGFMLNFIKGYVQGRSQRVVINGTFSRPLPVKSGVPQGSILGPIIFVLFINDIYQQVSEGTNIALYADDTKIWRKIYSENDCKVLNKDIDSLHKWALNNGMKFNPTKCKVISVTLRRPNYYILPFDRYSYELGDCILDYVNEEKDLGVIITNKLNWESQQKAIISKASRQLGLLIRTCHFIYNQSQKGSLYITLIRSIFEHCRELWGRNYVVSENKFEPIQKRAVKLILNELHKSYTKREYFEKLSRLNLLPIYNYFSIKKLKLFHRIMNNQISIERPSYIVPYRSTRHSNNNNLTVSMENNEGVIRPFGNSFFPSTISIWNSIPDDIKSIPSETLFLSKTKGYIWNVLASNIEPEPD